MCVCERERSLVVMARPMAGSSLSLSSSAKNLSHRNQHITRCAPLSCIGRKDLCGAARKTTHTQLGGMLPRISLRNRRHGVVYASTDTEKEPKKEEVKKIEEGLKESGVTRESAREILKAWSEKVGHEISPEELRKILVGQSSRAVAFVLISTLLDAGAAYGAFVAGNFFGSATESYGVLAVIGQALAYAAAGMLSCLAQVFILMVSDDMHNIVDTSITDICCTVSRVNRLLRCWCGV